MQTEPPIKICRECGGKMIWTTNQKTSKDGWKCPSCGSRIDYRKQKEGDKIYV